MTGYVSGRVRVSRNAETRATTGFGRLVLLVLVEKLVQPEHLNTHTVATMCVLVLSALATFPPCPDGQPGQTRAIAGIQRFSQPGHNPDKTPTASRTNPSSGDSSLNRPLPRAIRAGMSSESTLRNQSMNEQIQIHPGTAEGWQRFMELLETKLTQRRGPPPKCPNCETAIRNADMAGTYCMWSDDGEYPNGYLLCRSCWASRPSPAKLDKLEARVSRNPGPYIINIIDTPYGDLALNGEPVFHQSGDTPWATDDRIWFEANPGRALRIRAPFDGELFPSELPEYANAVLVAQLRKGARTRNPVFLFEPHRMDEITEEELWQLNADRFAGPDSIVTRSGNA